MSTGGCSGRVGHACKCIVSLGCLLLELLKESQSEKRNTVNET